MTGTDVQAEKLVSLRTLESASLCDADFFSKGALGPLEPKSKFASIFLRTGDALSGKLQRGTLRLTESDDETIRKPAQVCIMHLAIGRRLTIATVP